MAETLPPTASRRTGGDQSLPTNPIGCFVGVVLPAALVCVNRLFIIFAYDRKTKALPWTGSARGLHRAGWSADMDIASEAATRADARKQRNSSIMLTDRRRIEFDADALVAAITSSPRAAESLGLPRAAPYGARFYPEECEVEFLYGTMQTPRAFRLKAAVVGAFLVSYCVRARLPLPRDADKRVRIEANAVILTLRTLIPRVMTVAEERHPVAEPLRMTSD